MRPAHRPTILTLVRRPAPRLDADDLEREFDRAAPRYDLMVRLNRGYHDYLRAASRALAASVPRGRRVEIVDLGCGSGASTAALLDGLDGAPAGVLGLDASGGMIARATAKVWPDGVRFEHRRAEELPAAAGDGSLDGVLACYLFRNLEDPDAVLADVYRALRPGGTLVVQEYALRGDRRTAIVWSLMCWLIVVPLSVLLTGRARLYRYLWRSVREFDTAGAFERRMAAAGFAPVTSSTVRGWPAGILHTVVAHRPA